MNSNRQATRANYDRLSRWYDILSGSSERPARERGVEMLDIQPGERVLEIGCGTGEALSALAARAGCSGCVLGLDLSAGMLRRAKSKLGRDASANIQLMQGDSSHLPFADESLDAIFMSFTLELFADTEIPSLLAECRRVLRPGGRMGVVSLLQKHRPGWMEKAYTWAHRRWPVVIDCHPIPLEVLLQNAGFEISSALEMGMWGLAVGVFVIKEMEK